MNDELLAIIEEMEANGESPELIAQVVAAYEEQNAQPTVKKKDDSDSASADGSSEPYKYVEPGTPIGVDEYGVDIYEDTGEEGSDASKKLGASFKETLARAYQVPTYINESMLAIMAPDEVLEAANALPPEERRKAINEAAGMINPLMRVITDWTGPAADKMFEEAEAIRETTQKYETSIGEDLANFEFAQAGGRIAEEAYATIPSFMQAAIPFVGLASIGVTSAAGKSRDLQEEGEDLSVATVSNAAVTGAAEAALEKVSGRIGRNAFRGWVRAAGSSVGEMSETAAREYTKGITRGFVKEGLEEGATEALQTLSSRMADALISGQEDAWDGAWSELVDSFLIGAAAGGGFGSVGSVGETIAQRNERETQESGKEKLTIEEARKRITEAKPKVITEEAKEYSAELKKIKEENPEYWSVSEVSPEDATAGTIIQDRSGRALVKEDGDITGLYKRPTSKAKGVAQRLLKKAVAAGGTKLDNFDNYLTKIYKEAGFRVAARMPFNEEFAPEGWNPETDGRPDVVAMVYDPEGKLDIGRPKKFKNNEYDQMLAYRDEFLLSEKEAKKLKQTRDKIAKELPVLQALIEGSEGTRTGELSAQAIQATETLAAVSPETEVAIFEDQQAYDEAVKELGITDTTGGVYDPKTDTIYINQNLANNRTIAHETFHAVLSKIIKSDEGLQEASRQLINALRPSLSRDLRQRLDQFVADYDAKVQNEEKLSELFSIMADGYTTLEEAQKSKIRRFLERVARLLNIGGARDRISNKQAVELMNTLAAKFAAGEAITQADISPLQNKIIQRVKGTQQSARAQAARLRAKKETLEKFGLKDKDRYNVREIGEALDRRTREVYQHFPKGTYTAEAIDAISNHMVEEVIFDIESNPEESAAGWYTEKYQASLDVIAQKDASLEEQDNRDLFTMFLAVTSDGQKVDKNFELAYRAYSEFKLNGQVDASKFKAGDRTKSIQTNIKNINRLLSEKGIAEAKKYLIAESTVGEIKKENKKFKSNFLIDEVVPRSAAIFGEKLGMFYANLSGSTGYLTMDRWWSRTFNRYRGELVPTIVGMKGNTTNSKGNKVGLAAFKEKLGKPDISDNAALKLATKHAKAYADKGFKKGTEIEKAANTLYKKAFVELNDAPFNASDRSFMIQTVREAQKKLASRGYSMTIADIQAVLWYFEKMLYIELGGRAPKGISYYDAAVKLRDNTNVTFYAPSILDDTIEVSPDADLQAVKERADRISLNGITAKHSGVKLQKADPLHKAKFIVRLAKANKISENTIRQYLKDAGYSAQEIQAVVGSRLTNIEKQKLQDILKAEGMTEEDAVKFVEQVYKKANEIFQNPTASFTQGIASLLKELEVSWIDRQGVAKGLLTRAGMDQVVDYIVTSQGASGYAKYRSEEVYDKVFADLNSKEREILDQIMFLKRVIAIDSNKEARAEAFSEKEQAILHSGNFTKLSAEKALAGLMVKHGEEIYNKVDERSEILFNEYGKLLKELREAGIISQQSYDAMKDIKYQRRLFEKFATDINGELNENIDNGQGLADGVIKGLTTGSTAAQNMDAWFLFQDHAQMVARVTFLNRQNTKFAEEFERQREEVAKLKKKASPTPKEQSRIDAFEKVEASVVENPIVGYTESGNPKYALDGKDKRGLKALYYWKDGERNQILMEENLHKSFADANNTIMNATTRETVATISGTSLVKTFATGNNPLFFVTNLPRDFAFILAFSGEYSAKGKNKWLKALNPLFVPIQGAKLLADLYTGVQDVTKNSEEYRLAMKYGLSMDFLALQGRHNQRDLNKAIGAQGRGLMQDMQSTQFGQWFHNLKGKVAKANLASEVGFRMALFRKSVKKQLNGRNKADLSQQELDVIYTKAVKAARELTDFNQGGRWAKTFDAGLPYLNAAIVGTAAAEKITRGRRLETAARVTNLVGWSTAALMGAIFLWLKAMKDDEDEEIKNMTPAEVYFATLKDVSEYDLMNYYIIPLGVKDGQGRWQYERIAKQQTLSPVINAAEWILRDQLAKAYDIFYNQGEWGEYVGKTMKKNLSPIDIDRGIASAVTSVPIVDGAISWQFGIDPYTGDPLDWKKGDDLPEQLEGIADKNVEAFYKELGEAFGKSPVRMQAFTESIITSPAVNPYIGIMYGLANGIVDKNSLDDIARDIYTKGRRRVTKSGSEYNALSKVSQEWPEDVVEEMGRLIKLDEWTKDAARAIKKGDKVAEQEALDKIAESTDEDAKRILKNIQKVMKNPSLSSLAYNLKYTKEDEVKAYKLAELFGNSLLEENRGEKENKILTELVKEKIIDKETFKKYIERVTK